MLKFRVEKAFRRHSNKLLKKNPSLKDSYDTVLKKLLEDPFDITLHTHSLAGNLKDRYACSLTYNLRIIFKLHNDIIHLIDIGSHDEMY